MYLGVGTAIAIPIFMQTKKQITPRITVSLHTLPPGEEGPVGPQRTFVVAGDLHKSKYRVRWVRPLDTARAAAERALAGLTGVAAHLGGSVGGHYGYPAWSDGAVAVVIGHKIYVFRCDVKAGGGTLRKVVAAALGGDYARGWDGRCSRPSRKAARKQLLADVRAGVVRPGAL